MSRASKGAAMWVFVAALFVYNINLRYMVGGDEWPHRLLPLAVVLDGSLSLEGVIRYFTLDPSLPYWAVGTSALSAYPPATGLLAVPFYLPVLWLDGPIPMLLFAKLAASAMVAMSAGVVYAALRRLETTQGWSIVIALAYAFATPVFAGASQNLSQHSSGSLAVALLAYCAVRVYKGESRWAIGGALAGALAFSVRPLLIFSIAPLALLTFLKAGRYRLQTIALALAGAGAQLLYNLAAYGRLSGGYSIAVERFPELGLPTPAFGNPIEGVAGLLISPGRGLFVFAPVTLVAIVGAAKAIRGRNWLLIACAAGALAQLLFFGSYQVWWGGFAYGPRYLIEAMPLLALLAQPLTEPAEVLSRRIGGAVIAILALVSIGVQLVGSFSYPCTWDALPTSVDSQPSRVWSPTDTPVTRCLSEGSQFGRPWVLERFPE